MTEIPTTAQGCAEEIQRLQDANATLQAIVAGWEEKLIDLRTRAAEIALAHGAPVAAGKIRSMPLVKRIRFKNAEFRSR